MLDKIKWFWRYYKRYPYVLAVLLLLTPVQTVFQVSIPRLIEFIIDFAKTGQVSQNWAAILIAETGADQGLSVAASFVLTLIGIGFIAFVLYAFVQSHRGWMNIKLEWLFRQDAFNGITIKGPDFLNRFRTGDLVTRMTDDVAEKLSWFACSGIFRLYEALMMVVFTVAMMAAIDPILTLWTAGPLPILILIFFKSSSTLDRRYDKLQKNISRFNNIMEACFSGIRVIKAYAREDAQKRKFDDVALDRRAAEISAVKATTVVDSLYFYIWQFGIIIALLAGGYMVINANLTLGKLVAFIYYIVYLVFPMFDIGQFLVKSRQSAVSINRLTELEKVAPMVGDRGKTALGSSIEGRLIFEDIDFRFPDSDRKIIEGISLEIEPGQTVAIVGKIGSGKTWLVNMIPRLVDPTGGAIRLDGRDLREFKLEDLRRNIGYVPQEPVLFSDTVKSNIRFGRDEITDDTLQWAIEVSQLKDEIAGFPNGIDTRIGTRGVAISGGQKQRLALARALVGKPRIIILDDCTSALDSRTEAALWDRLHEVLPDMTAIVITHRPDTLERADRIFVLDDGKIVESGSHFELMDNGGIYSKIYRRYQLEEQVK
jgi:ATP-binding cassette subfamily B protein